MSKKSAFVTGFVIAVAMISVMAAASASAQNNPITWAAKPPKISKPLKPGDKFNVQVTAQIAGGWHLYSLTQPPGGPIPTRITLADGQPFKMAGSINGPSPFKSPDPNFGIDTEYYENAATFTVPVRVAQDAAEGKTRLLVNAYFQACNDQFCLPPKTVKLELPLEITAASAQDEKAAGQQAESSVNQDGAASEQPAPSPAAVAVAPGGDQSTAPGSVPAEQPASKTVAATAEPASTGALDSNQPISSFIWLAITLGALSLLTPCVFPMVPITVSYFTNHAAGRRSAAVRDAVIYALGIIFTFTALGVLLAVLFGAAGINKFASSPLVNLFITAIFISFALSLFGAFTLQVPSKVLTKLDKLSSGKQSGHIIGLLLMGLTFSLTSFTCTAPFVGTLLVMAAQGNLVYPIIGMLAFSTMFALPFFILALVPQLVSQLPRSGGWMNSVKVVMGLLEIAAAMKFLSNVDLVWHWGIFTREVVLASWVAVALLISVYLLGKFQLTHDTPTERIGAGRLVIALVSLSVSFYLLTGLFGARLGELESFLPPATEGSLVAASGAATGELSWIHNDYEQALARSRAEKKPVLIDFTGYTCTNCRWMEANMFPKSEVKRELEKYVRVRLYTDGEGELYERHQKLQEEKFGTVALPYYAVVDAEGNALAGFPGLTRSSAEFVTFLQKGHTAQAAQANLK